MAGFPIFTPKGFAVSIRPAANIPMRPLINMVLLKVAGWALKGFAAVTPGMTEVMTQYRKSVNRKA
jgi:hypothetical protein